MKKAGSRESRPVTKCERVTELARRTPFTLATRAVPRLALRPENTALVVQDMQRYFVE
ncbi:MAG: hypothetical protein R6U92_01345 [Bacillota bacterium]